MSAKKTSARKRKAPIVVPACFCYMVECADGTFYTGWAIDAERRVKVHNSGRGARYTSTRRPVKLVYVEPQPDRTTAMKRELAIKRLPRAKKQALISGELVFATSDRKRRKGLPAPSSRRHLP